MARVRIRFDRGYTPPSVKREKMVAELMGLREKLLKPTKTIWHAMRDLRAADTPNYGRHVFYYEVEEVSGAEIVTSVCELCGYSSKAIGVDMPSRSAMRSRCPVGEIEEDEDI